MAPTTNYSKDLGDREPLSVMRDSGARLTALTRGWSVADFERPYAPGKWTARQIVTHLAQTELALGVRARMALATPNYTAQAFDQDLWIGREARLSGSDAVAAFAAICGMNLRCSKGCHSPTARSPWPIPSTARSPSTGSSIRSPATRFTTSTNSSPQHS